MKKTKKRGARGGMVMKVAVRTISRNCQDQDSLLGQSYLRCEGAEAMIRQPSSPLVSVWVTATGVVGWPEESFPLVEGLRHRHLQLLLLLFLSDIADERERSWLVENPPLPQGAVEDAAHPRHYLQHSLLLPERTSRLENAVQVRLKDKNLSAGEQKKTMKKKLSPGGGATAFHEGGVEARSLRDLKRIEARSSGASPLPAPCCLLQKDDDRRPQCQ